MRKKRTVLIWDHDAHAAGLYARKFEAAAWRVRIAENKKQALALWQREPDAFLFDEQTLRDNDLTPGQWAETIRLGPGFKAIFLEVETAEDPDKTAADFGADTYLYKAHFAPMEAVAKIEALIGSSQESMIRYKSL